MDIHSIIIYGVTLLAGTAAPILIAKFIPNSTFNAWGFRAGKALSSEGTKLVGAEAWTKLENTLQGSFLAFSDGFQKGLGSDNGTSK